MFRITRIILIQKLFVQVVIFNRIEISIQALIYVSANQAFMMMVHLIHANLAIPHAWLVKDPGPLTAFHVMPRFLGYSNFLKILVSVNQVIPKIPSLNYVPPVIHLAWHASVFNRLNAQVAASVLIWTKDHVWFAIKGASLVIPILTTAPHVKKDLFLISKIWNALPLGATLPVYSVMIPPQYTASLVRMDFIKNWTKNATPVTKSVNSASARRDQAALNAMNQITFYLQIKIVAVLCVKLAVGLHPKNVFRVDWVVYCKQGSA